ncbi:MAG: hypothetical protein JHC93_05640 [Parachlamydiales bacterium]|nr:hypothetical protein [Parachlamydiales bacterium]
MPSSITYDRTLIEKLPLEILPTFIHHLGPKDTNTSVMVCKLWNDIFNDNVCWKSFNKDYKFLLADERLKETNAHLARIQDLSIRKNIAQGNYNVKVVSLEHLKNAVEPKYETFLGRWGNDVVFHLTDSTTTQLFITKGETFDLLDCGTHLIRHVLEFNNKLLASTSTGKIVELRRNENPCLFYDGTNCIIDMSVFLDNLLIATRSGPSEAFSNSLLIINKTGTEIKKKQISFINFLALDDRILVCSTLQKIRFLDKDLEFLKVEHVIENLIFCDLHLYNNQIILQPRVGVTTIFKDGQSETLNPLIKYAHSLSFSQNYVAFTVIRDYETTLYYGDVNSTQFQKVCFEPSLKQVLFLADKIFTLDKDNLHVVEFTS